MSVGGGSKKLFLDAQPNDSCERNEDASRVTTRGGPTNTEDDEVSVSANVVSAGTFAVGGSVSEASARIAPMGVRVGEAFDVSTAADVVRGEIGDGTAAASRRCQDSVRCADGSGDMSRAEGTNTALCVRAPSVLPVSAPCAWSPLQTGPGHSLLDLELSLSGPFSPPAPWTHPTAAVTAAAPRGSSALSQPFLQPVPAAPWTSEEESVLFTGSLPTTVQIPHQATRGLGVVEAEEGTAAGGQAVTRPTAVSTEQARLPAATADPTHAHQPNERRRKRGDTGVLLGVCSVCGKRLWSEKEVRGHCAGAPLPDGTPRGQTAPISSLPPESLFTAFHRGYLSFPAERRICHRVDVITRLCTDVDWQSGEMSWEHAVGLLYKRNQMHLLKHVVVISFALQRLGEMVQTLVDSWAKKRIPTMDPTFSAYYWWRLHGQASSKRHCLRLNGRGPNPTRGFGPCNYVNSKTPGRSCAFEHACVFCEGRGHGWYDELECRGYQCLLAELVLHNVSRADIGVLAWAVRDCPPETLRAIRAHAELVCALPPLGGTSQLGADGVLDSALRFVAGLGTNGSMQALPPHCSRVP